MNDAALRDAQIAEIRAAFGPAIGATLHGYSTAEHSRDDGTWYAWPELPIRLEWGSDRMIAVSWSKFDDLRIETDPSAAFCRDPSRLRWVRNGLEAINPVVGGTIQSVALGRGEMSVEGRDIEIWTRILIETDKGWLEIFNALDANGYAYHTEYPEGVFLPCVNI